MRIKKILKSLFPEFLILQWHRSKAFFAQLYYGNPSKDLLVIGITGTKGKSTTANFLWAMLQGGGVKTGLIGTANIRIGDEERMNEYHMTMPSPMIIQKLFSQMKQKGCKAVVMEVTSEGIKQFRHLGIHFSAGVFTNLSPEHLSSHNNSFEEYAKTKRIFFETLPTSAFMVINKDDARADFFASAFTGKKIFCSWTQSGDMNAVLDEVTTEKTSFSLAPDEHYHIWIGGSKNAENALLGVAVAKQLGLSSVQIQKGLDLLHVIPGRMEKIDEGQDFTVFVDYAHEEKSMQFIMDTGNAAKGSGKLIVLLGAEGGGRDPRKRAIMGKIVGDQADVVIVSNVDPYEDDPTPICEEIAEVAEKFGKKRGENLFVIEDRREGIAKALSIASHGDIVFITGKGSEQTITIGGVSTPWDDRTVVAEELQKLLTSSAS